MATATLNVESRNPIDNALELALEQLRWVVSQEAVGDSRNWAAQVGEELDHVEAALRQQMAAVKDPDGKFAEVDTTRPTLDRQLDTLRDDHAYLLEQVVALRDEVRRLAQPSDSVVHFSIQDVTTKILDLILIRKETDHLAEHQQQNRQAGNKLVQESMNTDIGGGD